MDEMNRTLREAVAARLGATAAREAARATMPDDVPQAYRDSIAGVELTPATPVEVREPEPFLIRGTMPQEQLAAAWSAIRDKAACTRQKAREPAAVAGAGELVWSADASAIRVIGIAGQAGVGKNTVASMIPGAWVVALADPLYAMLAAMLGIPEAVLRHRRYKEQKIPWIGRSVRQLLQTLGTEWGRDSVCDDVWICLLKRRINQFVDAGITTFAVADVRFANEAAWIREIGGCVWHVYRPNVDGCSPHSSEAGIDLDDRDYVIDNAGTMDDLRQAVLKAFHASK